MQPKKRKEKKKAPKPKLIEFLEPTEKDKNLAKAFGGEAKPEIRRPKVKYDKERLANSKKFRIGTADEPRDRAQLNKLEHNSQQNPLPATKKQGLMGDSVNSKQP
jgi:hypothetical protein